MTRSLSPPSTSYPNADTLAPRRIWGTLIFTFTLLACAFGQSTETFPPPGQPAKSGTPGQFELIGSSLVSAQQIFLGTEDKVFFVDKVENNPAQINGHPAWASEWATGPNTQRPMDGLTNAFCAGGNVLGNGTWLNIGGNQAVTYGGEPAESQHGGGAYDDPDGRRSIRLLTPCDDGNCDWALAGDLTTNRWYPTVETLEDGHIIILGGCNDGGYVNDARQTNPTYEFFPSRGRPITSPILVNTLPANLYPLTWLLPSGRLLIQSNWATVMLDYKKNREYALPDIPDAVRTYPASAGTIMLPLTPANNWTATILFCGGSNLQPEQWVANWNIPEFKASTSCVSISPDVSKRYVKDDPLPEGRSMANLIFLPTGQVLCINGARTGTAGYGNQSFAIGQSYADNPVFTPTIYDPNAPAGQRWNRDGLGSSNVPRLYHSSAVLLPDGSVFVSGSNPNSDVNVGKGIKYPTEYRTERFYPLYYNERRPQPVGLLKQIGYGGESFNVHLSSDDLFGDVGNVKNATVALVRTGFSTHAMNMGQRYLQLESTYTGYPNGSAILHVSQLPPNPAIFAPGPAMLHVVVKGVPSVGLMVMLGNGKLGEQEIRAIGDLPESAILAEGDEGVSESQNGNGAVGRGWDWKVWVWVALVGVVSLAGSW
ncbi:hypothetical protein CCMSSC00406_0004036 [Pleurotus cornucopiae]|uniref:Uncharacterized protein n=1 Tax=Pleurotus cornucopiae TaxID=5321 RepID=A0ACB7IR39_PLECO|nr:hypothetical protein CCMSSC00406_0004036 [Pleurotus cornucopiae]